MSFVPTRVPAPTRRPGTVAVVVDGTRRRGAAVDLSDWNLDADTLVDAVRTAATTGPRRPRTRPAVRVDCEPAGLAHAHVCRVPPRSFDLHEALVAAARSNGVVPPAAPRLERARRALVSATPVPDAPDPTPAKRRVADTARRTRQLDERVAALRGRLQALRDVDADTSAVEAKLAEATSALTEVETEQIGAEQRLAQVERAARTIRDRRERRLRLEDRVANLRRRARRQLVDAVSDEFRAALAALPADVDAGDDPTAFTDDPTAAALAVASVADLDAPLVLSDGPFGSPAEAATRLDAPVIRL